MAPADHEELLAVLREHPGPVLLSSYRHPLYDGLLTDWAHVQIRARAEKGRQRDENYG